MFRLKRYPFFHNSLATIDSSFDTAFMALIVLLLCSGVILSAMKSHLQRFLLLLADGHTLIS
ncbi:hypothetical protein ACFPFV_05750 [Salinicoccus siamensis]|uniref:hypothetical protein n=1 Tax=Salinicoccus siamensis TaxID=381830 RepID=UPI00361268F8